LHWLYHRSNTPPHWNGERLVTGSSSTDEALYDAFVALSTREEAKAFLTDLCTPGELRAFAERWHVARLLDGGNASYREVAEKAAASTTTVVRVARFLKDMPYGGYRQVLDRLKSSADAREST
jgi:TrpR-related protein YerC/YecD